MSRQLLDRHNSNVLNMEPDNHAYSIYPPAQIISKPVFLQEYFDLKGQLFVIQADNACTLVFI